MRRKLPERVSMVVTKNRLLRVAVDSLSEEDRARWEGLKGQKGMNAYVFAPEDEIRGAIKAFDSLLTDLKVCVGSFHYVLAYQFSSSFHWSRYLSLLLSRVKAYVLVAFTSLLVILDALVRSSAMLVGYRTLVSDEARLQLDKGCDLDKILCKAPPPPQLRTACALNVQSNELSVAMGSSALKADIIMQWIALEYRNFSQNQRRGSLHHQIRPRWNVLLDGQVMDAKNWKALEKIPTKEELLTKIALGIKANPRKIAVGIKALPTKIAYGVKALSELSDDKSMTVEAAVAAKANWFRVMDCNSVAL
jgi:ribosomal protein L10